MAEPPQKVKARSKLITSRPICRRWTKTSPTALRSRILSVLSDLDDDVGSSRAVFVGAWAHLIPVDAKALCGLPEVFFDPRWHVFPSPVLRESDAAIVREERSATAPDSEHIIWVRPTDDAPMLELRHQRSVGVIVADDPWSTHGDIRNRVNNSGVAFLQPTIGATAVGDVVHPRSGWMWEIVAIGFHKALVLAWVPIVTTRKVLAFGGIQSRITRSRVERGAIVYLTTVNTLDDPPVALDLVKTRHILQGVCIRGKTLTISRVER